MRESRRDGVSWSLRAVSRQIDVHSRPTRHGEVAAFTASKFIPRSAHPRSTSPIRASSSYRSADLRPCEAVLVWRAHDNRPLVKAFTQTAADVLADNQPQPPRPGGGLLGAPAKTTEYLAETLALKLAPVRANVIAPGFVTTPLAERSLGDRLPSRILELQDCASYRQHACPERRGRRSGHSCGFCDSAR